MRRELNLHFFIDDLLIINCKRFKLEATSLIAADIKHTLSYSHYIIANLFDHNLQPQATINIYLPLISMAIKQMHLQSRFRCGSERY